MSLESRQPIEQEQIPGRFGGIVDLVKQNGVAVWGEDSDFAPTLRFMGRINDLQLPEQITNTLGLEGEIRTDVSGRLDGSTPLTFALRSGRILKRASAGILITPDNYENIPYHFSYRISGGTHPKHRTYQVWKTKDGKKPSGWDIDPRYYEDFIRGEWVEPAPRELVTGFLGALVLRAKSKA